MPVTSVPQNTGGKNVGRRWKGEINSTWWIGKRGGGGLKALQFFLEQFPSRILCLAELILAINNFSFDSLTFFTLNFYGSQLCLRFYYVVQFLFQMYTGIFPDFHCYNRVELVDFINFTTNFHPALNITWTLASFSSFLISLFLHRGQTNIYRKPTNFHS